MIISIPSSPACSTAPRVSASHSASSFSYFVKSVAVGGGAPRRSRFSRLLSCASNPWGTAEILDENMSSSNAAALASSSASAHHEISPPRSFLDARSEQGYILQKYSFNALSWWNTTCLKRYDLLLVIQKEAEAGRLPINVAQGMTELYHNYRDAVFIETSLSWSNRFEQNAIKIRCIDVSHYIIRKREIVSFSIILIYAKTCHVLKGNSILNRFRDFFTLSKRSFGNV